MKETARASKTQPSLSDRSLRSLSDERPLGLRRLSPRCQIVRCAHCQTRDRSGFEDSALAVRSFAALTVRRETARASKTQPSLSDRSLRSLSDKRPLGLRRLSPRCQIVRCAHCQTRDRSARRLAFAVRLVLRLRRELSRTLAEGLKAFLFVSLSDSESRFP